MSLNPFCSSLASLQGAGVGHAAVLPALAVSRHLMKQAGLEGGQGEQKGIGSPDEYLLDLPHSS